MALHCTVLSLSPAISMGSFPGADATTWPSRPNKPLSTPGRRVISVTKVTLSLVSLSDGITNTPGAVRSKYADALTFTAAVEVEAAAADAAAEGAELVLLVALLLVPLLLLLVCVLLLLGCVLLLLLVSFVTGMSATWRKTNMTRVTTMYSSQVLLHFCYAFKQYARSWQAS
jgi:hypothetical protein